MFKVNSCCPATDARSGVLTTGHGAVPTPAFMPVGSQATVKALSPDDLRSAGAEMILANAYHLYLRPGAGMVQSLGGLHRFMSWDGPILTDSGGFQVFSLASLGRVNDDGVLFRSHVDGSEHFLTAEIAIECQEKLGADIIMAFDQCHDHALDEPGAASAMERTHRWAERCLKAHRRPDQLLFGITQGGMYAELRRQSARSLAAMGFSGYAIGGLSIGEPKAATWAMLDESLAFLPGGKPRYLMGVGAPDDIVRAVARGVDLFDSVFPTRVARHGCVLTAAGKMNLSRAACKSQDAPVEAECDCYTCRTFSVAYLHHLFRCREMLAHRLATLHNVRFMMRLMSDIRGSVRQGSFGAFHNEFLERYRASDEEVRLTQKQRWLASQKRTAGP